MQGIGDIQYKIYRQFFLGCIGLVISFSLIGCERPSVTEIESASVIGHGEGIRLNASSLDKTARYSSDAVEPSDLIPDYAKPFVGQFHIIVECNHPFVPCQGGHAKVTVSLLPNGTIRRSTIEYGKVFKENPSHLMNQDNYSEDRWYVDESGEEMSVIRHDGLKVYYKIASKDHLIMNLEKMQIENQELYNSGFPQPNQVYELKRKK